jgi:outer membrane protein assembly factor BamB
VKRGTFGGRGLKHKWSFETQSVISATPLIVNHGEIHSITPTHQGKLYALDALGKEIWNYDATQQFSVTESFFVDENKVNSILDTPTKIDIDGDGKPELIFTTISGKVCCIDLEGKEKWTYNIEGSCHSGALVTQIGNEHVVIIGAHDKNLHMLNAQGRLLLKKEIGVQIENKPSHIEHLILIGGSEGEVLALNTKFERQWVARTQARITAQIIGEQLTRAKHTTILVASQDGKLYALNTQGKPLWIFETRGALINAPIVDFITDDDTKTILIGSCDNTTYCIDAFGELLWSYESDFWIVASPLLTTKFGPNKQVVTASYDQKLYILEGEGTYTLTFIPGLSGIVNQTGQHANILSKEAGENKGKSILEEETKGTIVGCSSDGNTFIITTKEGRIACYEAK